MNARTDEAPIAVNGFTMTEELFQEGCDGIFSKKQQKIMFFLGLGIGLVGGIFLLIQMLFHRMLMLGLPLVLLGIGTVIWSIRLPTLDAKRKWKAFKLKSHGELERTVLFFEDGMEVSLSGDTVQRLPYSEVVKVTETEHLWILLCTDKRGILLKKNGFSQGCFEAIKKLLPL